MRCMGGGWIGGAPGGFGLTFPISIVLGIDCLISQFKPDAESLVRRRGGTCKEESVKGGEGNGGGGQKSHSGAMAMGGLAGKGVTSPVVLKKIEALYCRRGQLGGELEGIWGRVPSLRKG